MCLYSFIEFTKVLRKSVCVSVFAQHKQIEKDPWLKQKHFIFMHVIVVVKVELNLYVLKCRRRKAGLLF